MSLALTAAHAETPLSITQIDQIRQTIGQQLVQQPNNRTLRFRYAQAAYQSDNPKAAKHHLRLLMRTSQNAENLRKLQAAYATAAAKSPWSFGINFSILPSTNINRTSSNRVFDTPLGRFLIDGGGVEESGVGARFGGRLNYESALASGAILTYGLEINRSQYPAERLNNFDGSVSLTWGKYSLNGFTQVTPYITRYVFDTSEDNNPDSTRYGVRFSHQHYLTDSQFITAGFSVSHRDYDNLDHLDGNFLSASLSYQGPALEKYNLSVGMSLTYSTPGQEHLRYVGASLQGELKRAIGNIGVFGINAGIGGRKYQGKFPVLGEAREGRFASIGASFQLSHIRVFNTSPKLSCKHHKNWSNVALYDFKSTDCAISFRRNF